MKNKEWDRNTVSNKKSGRTRNLFVTPDTIFEMDEDCMLSRQKLKEERSGKIKE